ncbi:lytic transglycosylase domain-containing protein [Streptomyces sp. WAC 01325]|uniref:aggregation-promoting factor C-terminal-like domain-containing protein n=1 Tax=Streptomyces TaxID=1883 RepID=UPI000B86FD3C|nr:MULTISPECIES: transglycosylase SLT domain-containing protein [unclassified Streptomyces]MCZ4611331.1 transglycosylase SLT domain-containing protein [Streptomyces sp. Lzd4kr]NUT98182.1 transglycosylase SLT domain-containing protein [Saccharothrix sp.]QWA23983.1 transglycosylase SLT domain-containing protein [Streptomyces sp. JCM17656]WCH94007.1 transglycosylase SLT domain-containing protein [Streptomyces moderatus]WSZ67261.1 lytic transglycosylase domain-containing protein [Streptomyces char
MLEGNRVSPISVRGFAVASATAVTAVGSVVGVASGSTAQNNDAEATAADSTLLADIPAGQQAQVQTESLSAQADVQAIAADVSAKKDAEEAARKAAAQSAIEKKEAAEKAEKAAQEAKEREEAEAKASRSSAADFPVQSSYSISQIQSMARSMVPSDQFQCFSNIVDHESDWNYQAVNPSSGAYGLFQALPGSKMSSVGADWQTNPATQIKWGLNYMNDRYGSPCGAWDFWQANSWY